VPAPDPSGAGPRRQRAVYLDGERGIRAVVESVVADLGLPMGLTGCHALNDARPDMLTAAPA